LVPHKYSATNQLLKQINKPAMGKQQLTAESDQTSPLGGDWNGETVSILDVLLVVVRNRKLIGLITLSFVVLGSLFAILTPPKYTASAKMLRESTTEAPSRLTGGLLALSGLGISLTGGTAGITVEAYPDILKSREVLLAVARSSIYFATLDTSMSLVDYYNQPPGILGSMLEGLASITIELPGTILRMFRDDTPGGTGLGNSEELVYPREEVEETLKRLGELVRVNIDRNTGIMEISVTTHDPLLSAQLAKKLTENLTERVRAIQTQKAREDLEFIQIQFIEAQQELEMAEDRLAWFADRNRNPKTANLQIEMERFQRKVVFKTQLFTDLQTKLTQEEIELQRSVPVITILQAAVPPLKSSEPKRKLILFTSLFLGCAVGILARS